MFCGIFLSFFYIEAIKEQLMAGKCFKNAGFSWTSAVFVLLFLFLPPLRLRDDRSVSFGFLLFSVGKSAV